MEGADPAPIPPSVQQGRRRPREPAARAAGADGGNPTRAARRSPRDDIVDDPSSGCSRAGPRGLPRARSRATTARTRPRAYREAPRRGARAPRARAALPGRRHARRRVRRVLRRRARRRGRRCRRRAARLRPRARPRRDVPRLGSTRRRCARPSPPTAPSPSGQRASARRARRWSTAHGVREVCVARLHIAHLRRLLGHDLSISLHDDWQTTSPSRAATPAARRRRAPFELSVLAVESCGGARTIAAQRAGAVLRTRSSSPARARYRRVPFAAPAAPEGVGSTARSSAPSGTARRARSGAALGGCSSSIRLPRSAPRSRRTPHTSASCTPRRRASRVRG